MDRLDKHDSDQSISECDSDSETKPLLFVSQVQAGTSSVMYDKGKEAASVEVGMDAEKSLEKPKGKITGLRLFVVASILVTELCERLTYYSVVANMVLFCTSELNFSSEQASVVTLVFSGTVYLIPVFGGYVADSLAGKYNTILGAGLIYVLGLFLLPASAVDYRKWFGGDEDLSIEARKGYFFSGLVFVAIGTGGIKANVGPFGAQQVDDLGADAVQSFFNWFYWFINAGAVVAYSGVAYVQQEVGFDFGFLIPLISMIIALIIFMAAKSKYKHTPAGGSILTKSCGVCCQSINGCNNPSWQHAEQSHGGLYNVEMIEGVKAVLRVLPVFILVIIYWAVYSQMSTSLFLQSERMDISVGGAKLPAAMLNIFNTIIILILIPIMDRIVYPLLAKYGKSPTHLQRIGIGMILAAMAMLYSGILEIIRKNDIRDNGYITQTLSKDEFNASKISMFAQIPEFAFIGSSEVFASISGLEFAYTQAPQFMQGLIMGLFLMTSGLGSYVASLIVAIVGAWRRDEASDWFPKEPNNGHLEYLLFLLAALTFINLIIFIFVAKWYKYKKPDFEQEADILVDSNDVSVDVHVYDNTSFQPESEKKPLPPEYSETSKL